jgi:succinyl-CoA synthetase beta subunit
MDLYEHQGKQLFAPAGIPVPSGELVRGVEEGRRAACRLGRPLAVKAQVLRGGRGKAGGVRIVRDGDQLEQALDAVLGMTIGGRRVESVLLEQGVAVAHEFYLAVTLDRAARRPLVLFSTRGGVDIEQVAGEKPEDLRRLHIDPLVGLQEFQIRDLALWAGFSANERRAFAGVLYAVWRLYRDKDATLVEINPLCRVEEGATGIGGAAAEPFLALDAKVTIDNNALFRHPELERLPGFTPLQGIDDPRELRAREAGIAYVGLEGDIGILGNGAGMVMSVLDQVAAAGGKPADFLDVGGGAREAQIAAALDVVLSDSRVRALLVTIFGGITRCDEVVRGLLAALERSARESPSRSLPVVVRLTGTNADEGRALLEAAGRRDLHPAATLDEAVAMVVELAIEHAPGRDSGPEPGPSPGDSPRAGPAEEGLS